jgi:ferric-dicitrate binding protein FerR (iron transport regulator)
MRHQRVFRNLARRKDCLSSTSGLGLSRTDLALLTFLLVLLLSAAVDARADDQIRAVRLSNVVGSVQILAGTETEFSQAYPNMPLLQGSTLKTGEDGRAEIQLEDGSMIRLTPNSSVAMTVLGRNSEGNSKTEVDLLTGLSYVEMKGTATLTAMK